MTVDRRAQAARSLGHPAGRGAAGETGTHKGYPYKKPGPPGIRQRAFTLLIACVQFSGQCVQFFAECVHSRGECVHFGGRCVQFSAVRLGRGWGTEGTRDSLLRQAQGRFSADLRITGAKLQVVGGWWGVARDEGGCWAGWGWGRTGAGDGGCRQLTALRATQSVYAVLVVQAGMASSVCARKQGVV